MNSVPEVVDKTQNFAAHKDEFLKDIYYQEGMNKIQFTNIKVISQICL